jgi:hypothetical protein
MKKLFLGCLFSMLFVAASAQAQEPTEAQNTIHGQGNPTVQSVVNALSAYTKWRDESMRNFPQGLLTPHYTVAIVAQRLDDHTAQVEMLVAAEMKHYTITIRPVTLTRQANGEITTTPVGNAVTINQKAGRKLNPGTDATRIGDTTTLVAVTRAAQALEIAGRRRTTRRTTRRTPALCASAGSRR